MTSVGTKSAGSFLVNPNSSLCELGVAEQLPVAAAASSRAGVLIQSQFEFAATSCTRVVQGPKYQ